MTVAQLDRVIQQHVTHASLWTQLVKTMGFHAARAIVVCLMADAQKHPLRMVCGLQVKGRG